MCSLVSAPALIRDKQPGSLASKRCSLIHLSLDPANRDCESGLRESAGTMLSRPPDEHIGQDHMTRIRSNTIARLPIRPTFLLVPSSRVGFSHDSPPDLLTPGQGGSVSGVAASGPETLRQSRRPLSRPAPVAKRNRLQLILPSSLQQTLTVGAGPAPAGPVGSADANRPLRTALRRRGPGQLAVSDTAPRSCVAFHA